MSIETKVEDGGPAFAVYPTRAIYEFQQAEKGGPLIHVGSEFTGGHAGMSLRAWLAGQVAAGHAYSRQPASAWQYVKWFFGLPYRLGEHYPHPLARNSVRIADALIAELKKGPTP